MLKNVLILSTVVLLAACGNQDQKKEKADKENMTTQQIPLKDFFRNPEKTGYKISPNGEMYAYLAPYESRLNVFVQKVEGGEPVRVTSITERDIAGFFWKGDDRIIYLSDNAGDENFYLVAVDPDGKNTLPLTKEEGVKTQIIDDLEEDVEHMIIGLNKRNPQIFDAYRINVQTGDTTLLAENPGNYSGWMTDHDGKLRLAVSTDGVNQSIWYRGTEEEPFTNVITTSFKEAFSPQFFEFDNSSVVYGTSNIGRDKAALVKFDLAKGEEVEELFSDKDNDISGVGFSRLRKVLTTVYWTGDKLERHYYDDQIKTIYTDLEDKLPGLEVRISSYSDDENKYMVRTFSDRTLGAYYFYDRESKELKKITEVSPWIKAENMAEMKPIQYKSRDGLTIHGYLTLPRGVEAKDLPVVVHPHGGPWARDHWGFNPEVQFLANRGYAVLQMNFRGSTSYGKEFWEASFKEWGQKMQDDITDGAQWLIEQGIADSSRIAIYGASYGGYATLAGLTYTPDLYACGVDYVGVSNLFTFMETIPPYWTQYLEMLYEMVGNPETDSAMLAQYSPSLNADKIKSPLFIAQGAQDPRVKKSESDQMVKALKERGVEVEYMVKDNEGHGFRNEENRFEFHEAMEKFLAEHIKD